MAASFFKHPLEIPFCPLEQILRCFRIPAQLVFLHAASGARSANLGYGLQTVKAMMGARIKDHLNRSGAFEGFIGLKFVT